MITEWFVSIGCHIAAWVGSLFPDWTPPDFLVHFSDTVNAILANVSGLGVWADWVYIIICVSAVMLVWGVSFGIKLVRAIVAHVPFFGGAG